ncbi:hypothetical protein G3I19_01655 [Streptomyces sp. SID10853]|uniref:hypothetical protein n=1 Tax=Streptomyces sp. SID10853 TaxID=2706028 RepID=UPI0013C13082|nr:hypothetical protein [Streptomyces sp. SID10853]NDZ77252.1 hypothetical protein [Streptomyces sp. SID10853]
MPIHIIVAINSNEPQAADELEVLAHGITTAGERTEQRPFDGEAALQMLIALSVATFPYFRTWIRSRADQRKETKVVVDGLELSGYTEKEVNRILDRVQGKIAEIPEGAPGHDG